jgi:hypothetical protein
VSVPAKNDALPLSRDRNHRPEIWSGNQCAELLQAANLFGHFRKFVFGEHAGIKFGCAPTRHLAAGRGAPSTGLESYRMNLAVNDATTHPRFVRGQSIRQRPPGTDTQNSRFGGVPRAWWYSAAVRS